MLNFPHLKCLKRYFEFFMTLPHVKNMTINLIIGAIFFVFSMRKSDKKCYNYVNFASVKLLVTPLEIHG